MVIRIIFFLLLLCQSAFADPNVFGRTLIGRPFDFMMAGQTKVDQQQGAVPANGTDFQIFPIPGTTAPTQGIIRNLAFIFSDDNTTIKGVTLKIYYDGEVSPSVSLPLASLIGYDNGDTTLISDLQFTAPFFSVTVKSRLSGGGSDGTVFNIKYPMPWTNGIVIALASNDAGAHSVWSEVTYQTALASSWNSNLRFEATRSNETKICQSHKSGTCKFTSRTNFQNSTNQFTSADVGKTIDPGNSLTPQDAYITAFVDAKNVTVSMRDTANAILNTGVSGFNIISPHTYLTRPAGEKGWIASIIASFNPSDSDMTTFLESNPRIILDQDTDVDLEWTGTEDMFGSGFYFVDGYQDDEAGLTVYDDLGFAGNGKITAYKNFNREPIRYVNGVTCYFHSLDAASVTYNFTTVYYKEM